MVYWTEETLAAAQKELNNGHDKYRGNLEEGWWAIPYFVHAPRMDQDPLTVSNFRTAKRMLVEKLGEDNVGELWARWYVGTPHCLLQFNPDALEDREAVSFVVNLLNACDNHTCLDEDDWNEAELDYACEVIESEWLYAKQEDIPDDTLNKILGMIDEYTYREVARAVREYIEETPVLHCEECGYSLNQEEYEFLEDVGFLDPRWSPLMERVKQYRIDVAHEFLMVPLPGVGVPAELPKPDLRDEEGEYLLLDRGDNEYVCPCCIIGNLQFV